MQLCGYHLQYQHYKDASCIAVHRLDKAHFAKVEPSVLRETLMASLKAMLEKCRKETILLDTCLLCPRLLNGRANLGPKPFHTVVSKMILLFYPRMKWASNWVTMKMVGFTWAACLTSPVSSVWNGILLFFTSNIAGFFRSTPPGCGSWMA